jgi:uncharacterized protein (TIGR03437 family)
VGVGFIAAFASAALAQRISPAPSCALSPQIGTYPSPPLTYPMTSDRYAVRYSVNGGAFTNAQVYISYYGGSNSSPFLPFSGYSATTSLSFASIPVQAGAAVQLRITKLWGAPFVAGDHLSVRPGAKGITATLEADGTALITRNTANDFAGEQFVLWWNRGSDGGAVEAMAFYLDPPYTRPTGSNVKVVMSSSDLNGDLSAFDTLDIEGVLAVPPRPGTAPVPSGAVAFNVPANIANIFLGPGAWLQGKLHFLQTGLGKQRKVYGTGVLDVSRFEYDLRFCDATTPYPDQSYGAISLDPNPKPDKFVLDGIVIADQNLYATDLLSNSTVNNVKDLGWNGNNDGFELGVNTVVSNVFIRSGDDSLKVWRSSVKVSNATVWQDYNGGVVNLGWYKDSPGDGGLIDGLYVIKTDWQTPTAPSWNWTGLNDQNNGVFVSLMVPGTSFGFTQPSLFRNIFIDDPPQVLFSLKILPPRCSEGGVPAPCAPVTLTDMSVLDLRIENLFSPTSVVANSIGFETLPVGYTLGSSPAGVPLPFTLAGNMNVTMTNVMLTPPNGTATALTSANAATLGKLITNGSNVNLTYAAGPIVSSVVSDANFAAGGPIASGSWVALFGSNLAPEGDSRRWNTSTEIVSGKFPTSLDGTSVTVNGKAAAVEFISPSQVNIQPPDDSAVGPVQVVVTTPAGDSNAFTVDYATFAPGLFPAATPYIVAQHADNSYVTSEAPAKPGEVIVLWGTGFGPAKPAVPAEQVFASSNPLANNVTVTIAGQPAQVDFAGVVGAGLVQINVHVPPIISNGDSPVIATVGGVPSQTTANLISIHN